jgi:hypothetical protein
MKANIFDRRNQVIGWTVEDSHRISIFDRTGRMLGFYVKESDTTHNAAAGFVGRGNQLLRLLR